MIIDMNFIIIITGIVLLYALVKDLTIFDFKNY